MKKLIILSFLFFQIANSFCQLKPRQKVYYTTKELMEKLNSYRSLSPDKISFTLISPKRNATDSIKQKLLSLLKREWTEIELRPRVEQIFREKFDYLYFQQILDSAITISKRLYFRRFGEIFSKSRSDTSVTLSGAYHHIYDSVYKSVYQNLAFPYKEGIKKGILEEMVPNEIVMAVAFAQIQEAIPLLKADLISTTKHYFDKNKTELALAKFGDKIYLKQIYKNHYDAIKDTINLKTESAKGNDIYNMFILNTQKSVATIADWIDTSYKIKEVSRSFHSSRPVKYIFSSYSIVYEVMKIIKNEDFYIGFNKLQGDKYLADRDFESITAEQLMYIKNWLIKNKGKYELD